MEIIVGFQSAKSVLSRRATAEFYPVSTMLRQRIKELFGTDDPEQAVRLIINDVHNRGDAALFEHTFKIDGIRLTSLEVSKEQIANAYQKVDSELISALKLASGRIRSFYTKQKESILSGATRLGSSQLMRPMGRIVIYAPGGSAS